MIILVHFLHKAALFDFNFRKVKFFSSAWNPFSAEIKMSVLCSTPKERSSTSNWPQIARDSIYYIIMLLYYNIKPWRLAAEALKPQFLYNLDGVILSCSSNVIPWNISLLKSSESKRVSMCSALLLHWCNCPFATTSVFAVTRRRNPLLLQEMQTDFFTVSWQQ